jgi:hypothetical protein
VPRRALTCALAALSMALAGAAPSEPARPPIAIVVGRGSAVTGVSLDELREIYLRRRRAWPSGLAVLPINLPADVELRQRFSRRVLGRAPADLLSYWNARYFEGVKPPLVLLTPAAVRAYLQRQPEAIGYLPASEADDTLRVVLELRD